MFSFKLVFEDKKWPYIDLVNLVISRVTFNVHQIIANPNDN